MSHQFEFHPLLRVTAEHAAAARRQVEALAEAVAHGEATLLIGDADPELVVPPPDDEEAPGPVPVPYTSTFLYTVTLDREQGGTCLRVTRYHVPAANSMEAALLTSERLEQDTGLKGWLLTRSPERECFGWTSHD